MPRIGEVLVQSGLINHDHLKAALLEQEKTNERIGDIIIRLGLTTASAMAPVLAEYFRIPHVQLRAIHKEIPQEIIESIPAEFARKFKVIPIDLKDNVLTLATFDPLNLLAIDTIRIKTGYRIQFAMASEDEIAEAIDHCYNTTARLKEYVHDYIEAETITSLDDEDLVRFGANDQPVVQYVRSLIVQAVSSRASDIHIQPKQNNVELALRIDGVLYHIDPPPKAMLPAITTRIKIMANLDIAEKRLPQDGRFKVQIGNREVDIRTSAFPTIYGESVVMRLLDTSSPLVSLTDLGLSASDYAKFSEFIRHPYGLVLVTGPTGSGKTTTLYSTLNEIKSKEKNIITLEDPVEYRLPFIQQSQINPVIGFDFASGLRCILRQDPDIIMVGEIRDRETAEIAINAALTGHLVFSTLHTNDAASATVRLTNMGVEPFLITSSLLGVVAQRLIRTICPDCKETAPAPQNIIQKLGLPHSIKTFYRGRGCKKCFGGGYKGRIGIFELLVPNNEICSLILRKASSDDIKNHAIQRGMKTLRQCAFEKLEQGVTTPEEVLRVTLQTQESHG